MVLSYPRVLLTIGLIIIRGVHNRPDVHDDSGKDQHRIPDECDDQEEQAR